MKELLVISYQEGGKQMSNKAKSYIMKKGKGEHANTKQEAGGKFPGHLSDWPKSNQNHKGGNHPKR